LASGCTEYDLVGDDALYGAPNPPDLDSPVQNDRIVQTTVASVDVLWIIDTSCSMSQEQALLASNFEGFMTYFLDSGLDYHIGVVSTNMDDFNMSGKLQAGGSAGEHLFIDPTTPDPVDVFQDMALMGTDSHYYEKGRDAAFSALELRRDTDNAGFYRDDANLAAIIISDENDYSSTITLNEFITWLEGVKPSTDYLTFSSIVGDELGPSSYDTCDTAIEQGTDYLAVTRAVGGIEWSICDEYWDQALEQLGMQAAGLRREFFLSRVPVVSTIRLWVELDDQLVAEFELETDFTYNRSRNSVRLNEFIPEPLSEVFIEYEVLAGYQESSD
jgi:hypothetical protein